MNSIQCPKCGRLAPIISFGYGKIAACCEKVLYAVSEVEAKMEENLSAPIAVPNDADIQ